ncbi:glycosyltransferase family 9 protein [Escherichia coli]|uniref:glycosyltransferase family 9 protein n=1 Tax=Escherichia coli TaxID=562 RepID=UPI0003EF42FC|nr:glycosyltransferase family 9 protein [Escherichia coli]EFA4195012.1 glycosyltransferase family 9 protein [Escherichia coli O96]EFG1716401.1 glycosyltransferase family 9 protein [Escherichia coli]EFK3753795.1 glycosyltransferase family 9 protein [Escherichia coli]EGT2248966.1 glycosyltransferase family 9 protein [Escherichia coli]EIN2899870.1 glycosyltransferase family 9 protein [Escherichia coli]
MFLVSLLRRIAFSYYDYKTYNFNIEKTDFVVIHIPDQIGDAMAIFPVIRALELHKIKHLLIVTSTINLEVFNALKLEQTKLTLVTMTMQDHATLKEIKDLAKNITLQYGTPDLCIEAMRKKNLKTMIFISQLKAKTNFQVVGLTMKCYSPLCKNASRMDQNLRAPVPMTWAFMMREAGFPAVRSIYELPLSDDVREEMRSLGSYIALNLEGSSQERTFSLSIAENLIAKIQSETDIPIVIVYGPKGEDKARALVDCYNNVYRLSLSPSIKRSAAIIKDAYIAITPDTSILHMASAYNTPVVAIYADYKTRWPAMADVSESVVVGQKIDNISLDEFAKALKSVLARI